MTFHKITTDVSQRDPVKKEFIKVGEVAVFVPLLQDCIPFITSQIKLDKDGKAEVDSEGVPLYDSEQANWIQGAIIAAAKAQARNKLVSKTAELKPGAKIATDWTELTAEGVRDGSGLKLAREFKESFADWVGKQGLSDAAANSLITIVGNKAALALQNDTVKAKVKARLEAYGEAQDEATLEKFMRPLTSAIEATAATSEMDF